MDTPESITRADNIETALNKAWEGLRTAAMHLREAQNIAEADYDHNADKITSINGALNLIQSAVSVETYTWRDYANARRRG